MDAVILFKSLQKAQIQFIFAVVVCTIVVIEAELISFVATGACAPFCFIEANRFIARFLPDLILRGQLAQKRQWRKDLLVYLFEIEPTNTPQGKLFWGYFHLVNFLSLVLRIDLKKQIAYLLVLWNANHEIENQECDPDES